MSGKMTRHRKIACVAALGSFMGACGMSSKDATGDGIYGDGARMFTVAAGSPGELGLLKALAEEFNRTHGTFLRWIKAGSGKALGMLKEKKVDMVIVHAPAAEEEAVREGWAIKRTRIGSNEFLIAGPGNDPAGIAGAGSAAEAFGKIAGAGARFFSRGDNSGTHRKEMEVWKKAGIEPSGGWYVRTGTFMTAALRRADEGQGYFMTDSSTWTAARKEMRHLKVLFRGDPFLVNTYHALCQPGGATPGQQEASRFADFLGSEQGQAIIRGYGADRYGEGLYRDAGHDS